MLKISLLSVVVILAVAFTNIIIDARAYAQSGQPVPTINLTAEQRHVLKENLLKDPNVKKVPANTSVEVGSTVPANILVQPLPSAVREKVSQIQSHGFFVKGDAVILVDTQKNTIEAVIE
jgi:hypothetical protein